MDRDKVKNFADKVFGDMAGAMTAGMGYVGVKTGLFRAMAGKGAMTVDDVTRESGLMPRYVEEWLKGMTCAGYLDYDAAGETYRLPDEHAFLLASDDTDHFMGGLFSMVPVLLRTAPDVSTAFARGGGVKFEAFGSEAVVGLDLMNRGQYEQRLTSYWLKALPDVAARLQAGGRALRRGLRRRPRMHGARQAFSCGENPRSRSGQGIDSSGGNRRGCRRIVRPRIVRCCKHRRSRCERAFRSHHRVRLHP